MDISKFIQMTLSTSTILDWGVMTQHNVTIQLLHFNLCQTPEFANWFGQTNSEHLDFFFHSQNCKYDYSLIYYFIKSQ